MQAVIADTLELDELLVGCSGRRVTVTIWNAG